MSVRPSTIRHAGVLFEVYDAPAAHALHRQSPHFLAYDSVVARAVTEKTVAKCVGRHIT